MPDLQGISHISLTVTDVDASTEWYMRLFGATVIMRFDEGKLRGVVLMLPNGLLLGFRGHPRTADGDRFDETRVGLDHLSFLCASRDEVVAWQERLDEMGIEHSPIADVDYGSVLVFRDPDNVQLEFHSLPASAS